MEEFDKLQFEYEKKEELKKTIEKFIRLIEEQHDSQQQLHEIWVLGKL